jgi:hypothetical protein
MTEAEWLACEVPETMRRFVWFGRPQPLRKLVLWAAACFTLAHRAAAGDQIAALEAFADGQMSRGQLESEGVSNWFAREFPALMRRPYQAHHAAIINLLREVVGNPFRDSPDLPLVTPTIISLAVAAHHERVAATGHLDVARLAVLSDAVEESGCTDDALLAHLRSPGPHVRGCWAVDHILGME